MDILNIKIKDVVYNIATKWGKIKGNITEQTDLKNILDSKANVNDIPDTSNFLTKNGLFGTLGNHEDNTITQKGISNAINLKQDILRSGQNIKTINGNSILGEGNILIQSGLIVENNAGAHNSIYRGKNISDLFYNGTLSQEIANGDFSNVFVGDYIIGQNSNTKYLVAHIDYRLNAGNTQLTTHHLLMIPEKIMGTDKMNSTNTTSTGYNGSAMHISGLATIKTTINNDFGSSHILSHKNYFTTSMTAGDFYSSTVDLMNEPMVYGSYYYTFFIHGTTANDFHTNDISQLSIFKHRPDLIVGFNSSNTRVDYWLRDIATSQTFCVVNNTRMAGNGSANNTAGIRPAFLLY